MDALMADGLLGVAREDGSVGQPSRSFEGIADVGTLRGTELSTVRLTDLGQTMFELMGLADVPAKDLNQVLSALAAG